MVTVSFPTIADADAIKEAIATSMTEAVYDVLGSDFDGVVGDLFGAISDGSTNMVPARTVSVTSSSTTGAFAVTDPIVVAGYDSEWNAISEELQLTAANGGQTIVGTLGFQFIETITVPAQADVDGTLSFGVRDIMCGANPPKQVRCGGTGALHVAYADGTEDTIPAVLAGQVLDISPSKIFGDSATTATNISLLFDRNNRKEIPSDIPLE